MKHFEILGQMMLRKNINTRMQFHLYTDRENLVGLVDPFILITGKSEDRILGIRCLPNAWMDGWMDLAIIFTNISCY